MTNEKIKRMFDAFYQAKRIRDMLPPLPQGVMPSYIQYLDVIHSLQREKKDIRLSDISDAMNLPRPGVTRTVKEMEAKPFGYEILDIKIGGVITRLKSTGYRIDNYLNGNVLRLEELEEERLPYITRGMDKRENLWNRIIRGCDLNDTI